MEIRGSKFHNMWFAFYSRGAYNITVDGNEYYNNIKYALDPHSGTHDMSITNNWLHHNPIGVICSLDCYNILIEGNRAEHNMRAGIFLLNPPIADDGFTEDNHVYNNTISNSEDGIREIRSHDNILEDNKFFNIESDE